ncbi:MAG: peptidoglycan-binding protein [Rhizobiaceae bacterium]|nr:peptidoglycan-binding protein [Rhizobiaceae bacterium]
MKAHNFKLTIATIASVSMISGQVFAQQATAPAVTVADQTPAVSAAAAASTTTSADDSDWQKEFAVWQAAANGNTIDEYQSYLRAYPKGKFAQIAQARIVKLSAADDSGMQTDNQPAPVSNEMTSAIQATAAPAVAADVAQPTLSLGTPETESVLLGQLTVRQEVQARLTAVGFSTGGTDGAFGPRSRTAIAQWQTAIGAPSTGFLSYDQLTRLRADSEIAYQNWLSSRPKVVVRHVVHTRVVERDSSGDTAAALGVMALAAGVIGGIALGGHHGGGGRHFMPGGYHHRF